MAKPEQQFLTDLKRSFKRRGVWFYKIPDTPVSARFTPAKPFDAVLCFDSNFIGLEAKWLDWTKRSSGLSFKMLRETQHLGLSDIEKNKGMALVALGVRVARGDVRAYFWEYSRFKKLCENFNGVIPRSVIQDSHGYRLNREAQDYPLDPLLDEINSHFFKI